MDYKGSFWKAFDFKILVDYERAKQFVYEKKIPNPRFSNMYITSFCNQDCQYCEYSLENLRGSIMPTERILKNIDEVADMGVKSIDFCGGGEPILHPDMIKILKYCNSKGIVVGLFTNLTRNDDKLLRTITNACSYIRISIDTFDEKKYNLLRRPKNPNQSFLRVTENIKKLVNCKRKYKSNIIIGLKMLITKFNYGELDKFIRQSIRLGVDSIQFKKVSLFDKLYVHKNKEKNIIAKLQDFKKKYENKIDILANLSDLSLQVKCFMHINHIFIDAFGDVYLCCYYLRRKSNHKLGNIYDKPIKDIWFDKRHFEVANNVNIEECNKMDCRWIKYNNFMKPFVYEDSLRQLDFV